MVDVTINATVDPTGPAADVVVLPGPPSAPLGGIAQQILRKRTNIDYDTEWHTLAAADIGAVDILRIGQPNGVAALDAAGLVPAAQLPPSAFDLVTSVQGRIGAVVLTAADVGALTQVQGDARYDAINAATNVQNLLQPEIDVKAADVAVVHKAGGDTIQPTATGTVGLIIKAAVGQSADLQEWQDSTGAVLAKVANTGQINGLNLFASGLLGVGAFVSGAQSSVVSQAAANVGSVIKGAVSQSGDLQQWQNSSGAVIAKIDAYGDMAVASSSTLGASLGLTTNSNVNQIGIIIRGATSQVSDLQQWQNSAGTALAVVSSVGRIGTSNRITAGSDPGIGQLAVTSMVASSIGLVVKGAVSQSGDLQQWQDSTGAILSRINSSGRLGSSVLYGLNFIGPYIQMPSSATQSIIVNPNGNPGTIPLIVQGAVSQSGDLQQWQDSTGAAQAKISQFGSLVLGSGAGGVVYGRLTVATSSPGTIGVVVRSITGQTADLQEWQDPTGVILARVDQNGAFISTNRAIIGSSSGTPGTLAVTAQNAGVVGAVVKGFASQTADLQQWQDSTGAVLLNVGSGGTVRMFGANSPLIVGPSSNGNIKLSPGNFPSLQYVDPAAAVAAQLIFSGTAAANSGATYYDIGSAGSFHVRGGLNDSTRDRIVVAGSGQVTVGGATANDIPAVVPLVVKGATAQTASLQEWQDSTGAVKAKVDSAGNVWVGSTQLGSGGASAPLVLTAGSAAVIPLIVKGAVSQTGDLFEAQDSTGAVKAAISSIGEFYLYNAAQGTQHKFSSTATTLLRQPGNGNVVFALMGFGSGATADLQQWLDYLGNVNAKVKASGEFESGVNAVAASDAGGGKGGIVLKSPAGTRYRVTVSDAGAIVATAA